MDNQDLISDIIFALCSVYDPEIPVNIYDLGLIYDIRVDDENNVEIDMTLTSPACPVAGILPIEAKEKVKELKGVNQVRMNIVWDPPWTMERMSEIARLELGFF